MVNNLNILQTKDLRIAAGQPNYTGAVLELAEKFGAKKLGFHLEIIDPKNFSCPYRWHSEEEELFVVLEGEAVVRCNGEFRKVSPNGYMLEGKAVPYFTSEEDPAKYWPAHALRGEV